MKYPHLPSWIGIGCVKAGTSWAWNELCKHPEIYSPRKEINYFNYGQIFDRKDYEIFFEGFEEGQVIGEWTPDYFHHYEAMHNIKEICPWAKLITIFRHPVERAFSNYKHALYEGRIKLGDTFNQTFKFWRIRGRSIYSTWLKQWYQLFPTEQIKIMWYEDIKTNPIEFIQELYRFLEVDDSFISDDYNQIYKFHYHDDEEIKNLKLNNKDRKKWLKYYLPYTEELEKMTKKNLSSWKI